jgi:hypothetical protein
MKWISVKDSLPVPGEEYPCLYLICHYNYHIEVAKFDKGDWYVISNRLSMDDEKCSTEGQPDYWLKIEYPL